jgi:hypothetical protein
MRKSGAFPRKYLQSAEAKIRPIIAIIDRLEMGRQTARAPAHGGSHARPSKGRPGWTSLG